MPWIALGLLLAALMLPAPVDAQSGPGRLPPALVDQIGALRAEKASRTPAQRKISSRLLFAGRMRKGLQVAAGIPSLRTDVEVAPDGTVVIDVRGAVSDDLLGEIDRLGGSVIATHPEFRAVRARLPLDQIEALASRSDVDRLRPAERPITHAVDHSEGDAAHRADQLRSSLGVDGTGIAVGVLSDGVDSLAALQSSGDLPSSVTVLSGQAGSGSEGTAMLEIVHDLAPGADLLFATAFTSKASFAANILALHAAGADVIVDDVGYLSESVFQDDDIAASVDTVTAAGALYFASAGNSGNFNDGQSGVWEGDWDDSGINFRGDDTHDFGGGVWGNVITVDSPFAYTLHWSDRNGDSGNDYDLYLVSSNNTLVAASTDSQNGNDDPYEVIGSSGTNDTGRKLVITRDSGSTRFLHLNTNRGRLAIGTDGQTGGHSAARDAFSVAAVDGRWPGGGAFSGTEPVQTYSSDGPRRVFYLADGTAITSGNYTSTGGELRQKPDVTAADCVSTATPGFSTFCGTSAAAPHAAAISALLLDLDVAPTPQEIRTAMESTALDIEAAGVDRDSGAGIVDALAAGESFIECILHADCSDGLFCNGPETCIANACVAGPGDPCSGGSEPLCDEGANACVECLVNGDCSDDGVFCNGQESCNAGTCESPGDPCQGDLFCAETSSACVECLDTSDCDDGAFCTGVEECIDLACVAGTGDPCAAGPDPFCDEAADSCAACLADGDCEDNAFCTGVETCLSGACMSAGDPCFGGPDPGCDEGLDICVACLEDDDCDDGAFCTGVETCVASVCLAGAGDPCFGGPEPICDEVFDLCGSCMSAEECGEGALCSAGLCVPMVPATPAWSRILLVVTILALLPWVLRRRLHVGVGVGRRE